MNNKIFIIAICCLISTVSFAQTQVIKGTVCDINQEPLTGVNVYWSETWNGTSTNNEGVFEINRYSKTEQNLIVSFVGYEQDTIQVKSQTSFNIVLKETQELEGVEVIARGSGSYISSITPIKTKIITSAELSKSSCCDLAGCFETEASVEPSTTNIVTNAKELRILGLSGAYNQLLLDGLPLIQGLSYTYGISGIPGTLVGNIHVSKGANSVLQGYESITGQINVMTVEPDQSDRLLINAFANSHMEKQFNLNYTLKGHKWNNLLAIHTSQPGNRIDEDEDLFMDLPLLTRYSVFNKLKYRSEDSLGLSTSINIRYLDEKRIGGQMEFHEQQQGTLENYGQTVSLTQPMIYTRSTYRFNHDNKLSLQMATYKQDQESWFGVTGYKADQFSAYANLEYEHQYKGKHFLKGGLSYRHLELNEDINYTENSLQRTYSGIYKNYETVPGAFVENTLFLNDSKVVVISGIRADYHNQHGLKASPRALIKYQLAKNTDVRISAGKGWRTVNLFSENINLLASSRDVVITEELNAEEAINLGGNFTHKHYWDQVNLTIGLDIYHTRFQNQIFPDYSTTPGKAFVSNFTGKSISNGLQVETSWNLFEIIDAKLAYNYLDVYREIDGKKRNLEFNSKHKVNAALSYRPIFSKWQFDMNLHWYGEQVMPETSSNPEAYQLPDQSAPYTLVNIQIQHKWPQLDIYGGCENIFDFRQHQPILGWQDPFGQYFDTSSAWGPTKGREIYLGIRFRIK